MERTCLLLLLLSTLVYCSLGQGGDLSNPASLRVSPDRSQFFEYESVSLSCEVHVNSAGWRVVRNSSRGILSECNTDWGKQQGSSCIMSLLLSHSGVYWCESGSGEHSNAVNITAGAVILESLALPVNGGDSVTLRCRYQETRSDLTAVFYKDGSLIRTETTGEMTIPAVSKSDEGLYKCTNSEGKSPDSWMTVTDGGSTSSSPLPTSPLTPSLLVSLLLSLSVSGLVAALSISLIILLVLFCKRNKDVAAEPRDVTYADVRITQDPEPRRRRGADSDSAVMTVVLYNTIKHHSDPVHQNVMVDGKRCSLQQR